MCPSLTILGPVDFLSDIENLVSFQRAMFEDYSFIYRTKIFHTAVVACRVSRGNTSFIFGGLGIAILHFSLTAFTGPHQLCSM